LIFCMLPASLLRPGLVERAPRGSTVRDISTLCDIYRSLRLRAISNARGRRDEPAALGRCPSLLVQQAAQMPPAQALANLHR
jgi:hypothetical protein